MPGTKFRMFEAAFSPFAELSWLRTRLALNTGEPPSRAGSHRNTRGQVSKKFYGHTRSAGLREPDPAGFAAYLRGRFTNDSRPRNIGYYRLFDDRDAQRRDVRNGCPLPQGALAGRRRRPVRAGITSSSFTARRMGRSERAAPRCVFGDMVHADVRCQWVSAGLRRIALVARRARPPPESPVVAEPPSGQGTRRRTGKPKKIVKNRGALETAPVRGYAPITTKACDYWVFTAKRVVADCEGFCATSL